MDDVATYHNDMQEELEDIPPKKNIRHLGRYQKLDSEMDHCWRIKDFIGTDVEPY